MLYCIKTIHQFMTNKFNAIKELKNSFEFNLDDVASNKFETTRSLFDNFTSAFNVKALTIATMMGLSVGVIAGEHVPLTAIQDSFNNSMKVVNTNYNENLPTYFENKNEIKDDTILKNEFWKGSVATLVVGSMNDDSSISDNKYASQIGLIKSMFDQALYAGQFSEHAPNSINPDIYYTTPTDYKHYFRNHSKSVAKMGELFSKKNKHLFDDFITYHEMAHASFEQESIRIDELNPIKLTLHFQFESHSDVSSILMVAKKHNLNYNEFRDFALNVAEIRSKHLNEEGDLLHNSSSVIAELIHTFDNNKNLYTNMSTEKISSFSAYFVYNVSSQNGVELANNLKKIGLPTRVGDFVDKFEEMRKALKAVDDNDESILATPINVDGVLFYSFMLETIYFQQNPEKSVEYNKYITEGDIMSAGEMRFNLFKEFMDQNHVEKSVYAVAANKFMNDLDFITYSRIVSSYYQPSDIIRVHSMSSLNDIFKENKKEINHIISSENTNKNKI